MNAPKPKEPKVPAENYFRVTMSGVSKFFFFGPSPREAYAEALAAARGDQSKIIVWRKPQIRGPWDDVLTIVMG